MKRQSKVVNIGMFGLGTVGTGVAKVLKEHAADLEAKTGNRLVLKKVCVKSLSKKRGISLPKGVLTTNPNDILNNPDIDIVVELIGGIQPAKNFIERALKNSKHVVTANKALLAEQGTGIYRLARSRSLKLGYEASVCGGIPIIKSLKEGLASNDISQFMGIVNGTCNYILTAMSRDSRTFSDTLKQAQVLGYAEQNPAFDVEGIDSAHKLAILGRLSFKSEVNFKSIYTEGISSLSKIDIDYAKELGYVIKLLAIGKKHRDGLELRVHPTLIAQDHPLANVRGVYNAVFIQGDQADDILFYGKGAGMLPTASAVMSDIIDIAKRISGWKDMAASARPTLEEGKVLPIEAIHSKYYLRFQVADKPGVLGRIAQTLGNHKISILSVHQKESHDRRSVPVVILTYEASEKHVRTALKRIDGSKDVRQKTVLIRVEK